MKLHKQAAKYAKKASKQRQIMPRTDDILAIEQQAISFILDGDLELPEDVEVAATGPVETVEFVQTAEFVLLPLIAYQVLALAQLVSLTMEMDVNK